MANVYAVKSGNWSDTTVWNTGALPTSADDVYANNFTVTVDISPTVLSVRNTSGTGITAGGNFFMTNGATLTSTNGFISGGPAVIFQSLSSGQSSTVNGNFQSGGNIVLANLSGFGTLNINGNMGSGGTGGYSGLSATQGANCTITGNLISNGGPCVSWGSSGTLTVVGSISGTGSPGINNSSSGTVNITGGSCTTTGSGAGVINSSSGSVNVTGAITSSSTGVGANNNSFGSINITGTVTGGSSTGNAFVNSSTGTITHIGTAQASATAPAIGAGAVGQVTILTGPLLSTDASYTGAASSGVNPCIALRWFPADTALSTFEYRMRGQTVAGSPSARPARQMFLTDAYSATYPTAANVRSGTVYGPASVLTGTCAVPAAASVAFGVPVDNTTGTATLTAANVRAAVGLASANLDTQLTGISSGISGLPSASAIASAVWAAATRTLTTAIDNSSTIAAAVWSYATGRTITGGTVDTLVNSPSVPSAASIASQVRTELSTELARIDVATSTRLAPSGTLARVTLTDTATTLTNAPTVPSASQIATQVRTELTPELARVANCATTQEVDDIVEGALS